MKKKTHSSELEDAQDAWNVLWEAIEAIPVYSVSDQDQKNKAKEAFDLLFDSWKEQT